MANLNPMRRNHDIVNEMIGPIGDLLNESFFSPLKQENKFKTDIRDPGDHYKVEAELPGFQKDDITVEYNDQFLTIKAVREENKDNNENDYLHQERHYGEFVRKFYLKGIRDDQINASFSDGVLTLDIPKDQEEDTQPRRIEIN